MKRCANCSESLMEDAKFCHKCGEKVSERVFLSFDDQKTIIAEPTREELIALKDIFKVKKLSDGTYEISDGAGSLNNYTVPSFVSRIGENAFNEIEDITEVTIGENVKYIDATAFDDNGYIDVVNITLSQEAMDSIVAQEGECGFDMFFPYLEKANIKISQTAKTIPECIFASCPITEIEIPNSVTEIKMGAFGDCGELERVTIGNSVKIIGSNAFESCEALDKIVLPESVEVIESAAFAGCNSLIEFRIPSKVKVINDGTFAECSSLETVYIGKSVEKIGNEIFDGCRALSFIYLEAYTPLNKRELVDLVPDFCEIERLTK